MGQYMAFLLGPEKFARGPVTPRAVAAVFEPLVPGVPYGYGLYVGKSEGGRFAYHDGSVDGFSSRIALWPDTKAGIAILAAQSSLLQSLVSLPALTEGARRIMLKGSAPRPFPLGRLYIFWRSSRPSTSSLSLSRPAARCIGPRRCGTLCEAKGTGGPPASPPSVAGRESRRARRS